MSDPYASALGLVDRPRGLTGEGRLDLDELRFAGVLAVVLAAVSAAFGLVWAAWSPPGPAALVVSPGVFEPDETEAFIAADGRFLVLAAVLGLLAALGAWRVVARRGPLTAAALVVGGLGGAALMAGVGHLTGGGTFAGSRDTIIAMLPLSLHAQGLLLIEPAVAVLGYGLLVAFAADDDLRRPDPLRADLLAQRSAPPDPGQAPSVQPGDHPQYGGGHGDAAGPLQQRDLPPQ